MIINDLPAMAGMPSKNVNQQDNTVLDDFSAELDKKTAVIRHQKSKEDKEDKPTEQSTIKTLFPQRLKGAGEGAEHIEKENSVAIQRGSSQPILAPLIVQLPLDIPHKDMPQTGMTVAQSLPTETDAAGPLSAGYFLTEQNVVKGTELDNLPHDQFTVPAGHRSHNTPSETVQRATPARAETPLPAVVTEGENSARSLQQETASSSLQEMVPASLQVKDGAKPIHQDAPLLATFSPVTHATTQATTQATMTSSPPAAVLNQELGSPAWQNSLSQQISLFTRNGIHNAELRLHPEELGSLQINLRLNNDQVQLHFVSDNHQVRAAIEAAMPHLRTTLAESGLNLEQSSTGGDTSAFNGSSSQSGQNGGKQASEPGNGDTLSLSDDTAEIPVHNLNYASGINTFV